jgi:hypothetical protein
MRKINTCEEYKNSKIIDISCKKPTRENNIKNDCCNTDSAGKVTGTESKSKSEKISLALDKNKKKKLGLSCAKLRSSWG